MSYSYQEERPWLFTENGQECILKTWDQSQVLLEKAGAFMIFSALKDVPYGDTFKAMAILDRLVEIGYLREVTSGCRGQDRVFVSAR